MRARLLALARSCGQRCEEVTAALESIATRLKVLLRAVVAPRRSAPNIWKPLVLLSQHFVAAWEGFEAERAELSLWLADLDVRLAEVDHLTGNTCQKLQQLQVSRARLFCVFPFMIASVCSRSRSVCVRTRPISVTSCDVARC